MSYAIPMHSALTRLLESLPLRARLSVQRRLVVRELGPVLVRLPDSRDTLETRAASKATRNVS